MKHKMKVIMAMLAMFIMIGFVPGTVAYAASAEVNILADQTEVTVGENIMVTIQISADTEFADFEANLIYDEAVLEYQQGSSKVAGSSGFLRILDSNISEGTKSRKYVLEFKALAIGTAEISFSTPIMVYDSATGIEMAVSSNQLELEVKAEQTASNNAFLKDLKISPSSLTPEFDKNIFTYSTTVDADTDKLIINASREDENAIIRIAGNESLKEGENKIIITVIAQSGDVIEYTINASKEFKAEDAEEESPVTKPSSHGNFEIIKNGEDLVAIYNGRYKIVNPGPDFVIPSGYMKTKSKITGQSIDVYVPEENIDYDFVLIYAENEMGEAGLYQYDKVERTMQRYNDEKPFGFNDTTEGNNETELDKDKDGIPWSGIIIAILSVSTILILMVTIRMYLTINKKKTKGRK